MSTKAEPTLKKRRVSYRYIRWDKALEPDKLLKTLRKDRLGVNQKQFDHLQDQLYVSGCLKVKKSCTYIYPSSTSVEFNIPDTAYEKISRKLRVVDMYNFFIWKYANTKIAQPSEELQNFFHKDVLEEIHIEDKFDIDDELDIDVNTDLIYNVVEKKIVQELNGRIIRKTTKLKINDEYTLQNVEWTVHQRSAARNTRDYFISHRIEKEKNPMLSDISFTENNRVFVSQFLVALLKANVSAAIISNICFSCFGVSNLYFDLEEKVLLKEKTLTKEKIETPMQRTSITDFSYMEKENKAACIIQRVVRKWLEHRIKAVQIIERFWFPYVIENEVQREVDQRRLSATLDMLDAREQFKYGEFKEEIIEDFKELNIPKHRRFTYWLKIYFFVILACSIEYVMRLSNVLSLELIIFTLWILFQALTMKMLNKTVIIIQTVMLIALTCRFLNVIMQVDNAAARFFSYVIIVNVCRQYWLFGLIAANVIRFALIIPSNSVLYFPLKPNEGFVFVYDIYSVITIAACHRVGNPIEMLHKWMVGVIFFIVIASGVAAGHIAVLLGTVEI